MGGETGGNGGVGKGRVLKSQWACRNTSRETSLPVAAISEI